MELLFSPSESNPSAAHSSIQQPLSAIGRKMSSLKYRKVNDARTWPPKIYQLAGEGTRTQVVTTPSRTGSSVPKCLLRTLPHVRHKTGHAPGHVFLSFHTSVSRVKQGPCLILSHTVCVKQASLLPRMNVIDRSILRTSTSTGSFQPEESLKSSSTFCRKRKSEEEDGLQREFCTQRYEVMARTCLRILTCLGHRAYP